VKRYAATFVRTLEHPVGHAAMQMHMPVKTEQPAGQIAAELLFNIMPDRAAALVVLSKPALQVLGDDLIKRRPLRPPTDIPLLWSRHRADNDEPLTGLAGGLVGPDD